MLLARIFFIPDLRILIVGSGDLQTDCIGGTVLTQVYGQITLN